MATRTVTTNDTARNTRTRIRRVVRRFVDRSDPMAREAWDDALALLEDHVKQQYLVKMRGGTDDAGIRWPETQRFQRDGVMMFDTSELFESIRVRIEEGPNGEAEVVLEATAPHAKYALAKRPAWYARGFPRAWMDLFTGRLRENLAGLIEEELAGGGVPLGWIGVSGSRGKGRGRR